MKKENIRKFISEYSILFVMLLMVIIMTILKPDSFMTRNNILNVLRQISITGVIDRSALGFCCITRSRTAGRAGQLLWKKRRLSRLYMADSLDGCDSWVS